MLYTIIFYCIVFVTFVSCKRCCPRDLHAQNKLCSDNKTLVDLPCSTANNSVTFILDPAKGDAFYINDEDFLVSASSLEINDSQYCLTRVVRSEGVTEHDVALFCHWPKKEISHHNTHHYYAALMVVSSIFMILTLIVYLLIPELRDLQGKILMLSISSLINAYVSLASIQWFSHDMTYVFCMVSGYTVYLSFLATFAWQNVISFNLWRNVMFRDKTAVGDGRLLFYYSLWGSGVPLLLFIINIIAHFVPGNHLKPNFGEKSCWFNDDLGTWSYFYGPMTILVVINIVFFVWTSMLSWRQLRGYSPAQLRSIRFKWCLYLKLFLIMGISWIFEIISYATLPILPKWIWLVTDSINCLQGVVIFCLLILFRPRVKRCLAKNKVLGVNWPHKWTLDEVEETVSSVAEELEMSRNKT